MHKDNNANTYDKNEPKLQQRFKKICPEQKINPNVNLQLQEFSPLIQISTETIFNTLKSDDLKNILWTTDITRELPILMTESGISSIKPITVMEMFENTVSEVPNEEALFYESEGKWKGITWYQYHKYAIYFAKALISLEIKAYQTVNIMGFNSPEWFISYMGGIFACVPPVGIYPTNNSEISVRVTEASNCGCLIVDDILQYRKYEKDLKKLKNLKVVIFYCELNESELKSLINPYVTIYLWKDFLNLGKRSTLDMELSSRVKMQKPGNCCNLIYTSGTTDVPKGVMLSHDNMTWTVKAIHNSYKDILADKQRFVSFLPLSHIAGQIVDIFVTMITKSQVYFANPDAMSGSLVDTLRKVKPTVFFGVPRIFEKFEEKIREVIEGSLLLKRRIMKWSQKVGQHAINNKFSGKTPPLFYKLANFFVFSRVREALGFTEAKVIASGAAPLKKSTIDFFKSLSIPIFNVYGMSETTGPQCLNLGNTLVDFYSSGVYLNGTELKICDPERDGVGEIFFRGRNRFMGYYKNEIATQETIDANGFIHSGDMGYINSKGNLVITGRIKEIIVTAGGENIAPIPIEENIKETCNIISHTIVIGDSRPYLVALVTIKSDLHGNLSEDILPMLNTVSEKTTLSSVIDAINDDKIKKYVQEAIDKANRRAISNAQTIQKWTFLPNDFTIETGELTPTHKLKRKVIEQKYVNYIQKLYAIEKF